MRAPYRFRMESSPDLAIGSWSDRGPWVVDPEAMPWRADVARRRAQARDQVPIWLQPGTFPPAGRVARGVARGCAAVAGRDLIDRAGSGAGRARRHPRPPPPPVCRLRPTHDT